MIKELEEICQDRESWRKIVREIVVHNVHAQKKKNTEWIYSGNWLWGISSHSLETYK